MSESTGLFGLGGAGFGGLTEDQRALLGLAALSDAFGSLAGREGNALQRFTPIAALSSQASRRAQSRQALETAIGRATGGQEPPPAQQLMTQQAPASLTPEQSIIAQPLPAPSEQEGFSGPGMIALRRSESGGRPEARPVFADGTPRSSAFGPDQFTDRTWLAFANANPSLFEGMSREQILAARTDGELNTQATQWYARQNAPLLRNAGFAVNDATLGLAHRFGGEGATRLLNANASTPVASIFSEEVLRANPELRNMTAGQVVQGAQTTFNVNGPVRLTPAQQTIAGSQAPITRPQVQQAPLTERQIAILRAMDPEDGLRALARFEFERGVVNQYGPVAARPEDYEATLLRELGPGFNRNVGYRRNLTTGQIEAVGTPQTSINIDQRAGSREAEARATSLAEEATQVRNQATSAASALDNIAQIRSSVNLNAADGLYAARERIGGLAEALGLGGQAVRDARDVQQFRQAANSLILSRQLEQRGVQTDGDRLVIQQTAAALGNTPAANAFILRAQEAQALRAMEKHEFFESHWQQNNTYSGATQAWNRFIREVPLIRRTPDGGVAFFNEFVETGMREGLTREQAIQEWRAGGRR